jgi:hypothetical protein
MDTCGKRGYFWTGGRMKLKNRVKRVADILEKLGVASVAIGVFQDMQLGLWMGIGFLIVSILLTTEDR